MGILAHLIILCAIIFWIWKTHHESFLNHTRINPLVDFGW